PEVIVGGREFAHVHPDGSLHASLKPDVAKMAVNAGWAISHPWADERPGWEGFVMIYTPNSNEELEIVYELVRSSYTFVTGVHLPN
ncbi:MAG: luciferase family protein, partial [Roseobacter sp.]